MSGSPTPRGGLAAIPRHRAAQACVLDALLAVSEAALFALLDEHPEIDLRPPPRSPTPGDVDVEARRLLDLLVELEEAVRRYALADTDDVPF
jgi:hypothetical protein